jgi:hypothetical protein
MARRFPGFAASFAFLRVTQMKQLMNAAKSFSLFCENVRKRFVVKDRCQHARPNGAQSQYQGTANVWISRPCIVFALRSHGRRADRRRDGADDFGNRSTFAAVSFPG